MTPYRKASRPPPDPVPPAKPLTPRAHFVSAAKNTLERGLYYQGAYYVVQMLEKLSTTDMILRVEIHRTRRKQWWWPWSETERYIEWSGMIRGWSSSWMYMDGLKWSAWEPISRAVALMEWIEEKKT